MPSLQNAVMSGLIKSENYPSRCPFPLELNPSHPVTPNPLRPWI